MEADYHDVEMNWLSGKSETEYRNRLYKEMAQASKRYLIRKMTHENKSEDEIEEARKKLEDSTAGPWKKTAVVSPPLIDLSERRNSVKFSKDAAGSRYPRLFWLDTGEKKFRYLHDPKDSKDQVMKAKSLVQCDYDIRGKDDPGPYKWDPTNDNSKYRLTMKFDKRPAGPVFVYENDLSVLRAIKAYGLFCRRTGTAEGSKLEPALNKLLATLSYSNSAFALNQLNRTLHTTVEKSGKVISMLTNVGNSGYLLKDQKKFLLTSWANSVSSRSKRFRPLPTIRLAVFLRSLARIHDPTEEMIYESAKKIADACKNRRETSNGIFDHEIREKSNRRLNGMPTTSVYEVSPKIVEIAEGRQEVPIEHKNLTKFNFPTEAFEEADSQVKVDYKDFDLYVSPNSDHEKILGKLPIGDISSIVLDEKPKRMRDDHRKWLKINGRKIKQPEKFHEENKGKYIDPASRSLAVSVDSYLSKKALLELNLHSVRLKDASHVESKLNTKDLKLRLRILSGKIFWTSLPFVTPKVKGDSISCDFKKICRIRVDPESSDNVTISLLAVAAEQDRLPDNLKTLKKEVMLGYIALPISNIEDQKKLNWVPLNNGIMNENADTDPKVPMLAMSTRFLKNVPGNFPEAPLSGKAFNINDLVTFTEEITLNYPNDETEFKALGRQELDFDPSRVGTTGTPLRYPANAMEYKLSNLSEGEPNRPIDPLENLIHPATKIPFAFRMPKDETAFKDSNFPGDYNELSKNHPPGGIVGDMDSYKNKTIYVLKAIDDDGNCYLAPIDTGTSGEPEIIEKKINTINPISEEGVCVFNNNEYLPHQMDPKITDHDWSLYLGFEDEKERKDFLSGLKDVTRDYGYAERSRASSKMSDGRDVQSPKTGTLQIYVSEAKNLPVDRLRKELPKNSMRLLRNELQVKIGFKAPKSVADLFTSVFVDESMIETLSNNLKKDDIIVEHDLVSNPSWSTEASPAGEMRNMGQLIKLPKTNALLTFSVCVPVINNGVEQSCIFGSGEIPLNQLLDENCPSHYYWILLQNNIDKDLPQLKIWSLFNSEDSCAPFYQENDPVRTFGMYLLETAKKETQVFDMYNQPVHLGHYNPNYMRIEQDFIANFKSGKTRSREEKIINTIILDEVNPEKASFTPWEYKLINAYRYLRAQAKEHIFHNMSLNLWDTYISKLMANATKTETMIQEEAGQKQASHKSLLRLDRIKSWRKAGNWKYNEIVALCKLGLPKELRPVIWVELFGLSGVDNPNFEVNKIKDYEKYALESMKQDSVVYRQIEQDVLEMSMMKSVESSRHKERAGILKIAKAYYAWCVKENESIFDGNKFVYFKGILHLIQKVWQLFNEVEAFWCIVGFAKALPYLFMSQNVMTERLSWNHKLLLLAITTVMEIKYPEIYKAILRHGLPIEYYISDKVFTMLSTVFPTDTLLRFYDIIALEAASEDPIRAMWVILTGCIMLMTLNEPYIKEARNADELELIINNTGINKLNTQMLVEEVYKLSGELFSIYNPTWEKFLAVIMNVNKSAVGMEYTWTKKALQLEERYTAVKELNSKAQELIAEIRTLVPQNTRKEEVDDTNWMDKFVKRFCKYYGDCASSETPANVYVYVYRCCHVPTTDDDLIINYGSSQDKTLKLQSEGVVDDIATFDGDSDNMKLKFTVKGNEERTCIMDLNNYETDMPITVDKALNLIGDEIPHNGQKPQPFISLVLLIVTKESTSTEDPYKQMKKCIMNESVFIRPIQPIKGVGSKDTITKTKDNIKNQFQRAGLKSIFVPGAKELVQEEDKNSTENDKQALLHLFSLVKDENVSYYQQNMPEASSEVQKVADNIYDIFSKHYSGKLPLKRIIVSLIAAGYLTVDQKLSYLYDIYTCIAGMGVNATERDAFSLDDIIELIQLLCELHLVYIPPEYIPHLTEQVITNGGVNRITNSYLISVKADAEAVLKQANLKDTVDPNCAVNVTEHVQTAFSKYWELWGHKQVFAGDPNSFCGNLSTVLGGYKGRPKEKGPYRLLICYKHDGEGYFKELRYDSNDKLVINASQIDEFKALLMTNRSNLSFVGERIRMTKEEFISRVKKIPLLTELMRLHTSINNVLISKTPQKLHVDVMGKSDCLAKVDFDVRDEEEDDKMDQEPLKPQYNYDDYNKMRNLTIYNAHKEDLLVEIKERIITEINKMIEDEMERHISREVPQEFISDHFNQSLQLFEGGKALDDYKRLEDTDERDLVLKERGNDEYEQKEEDSKTYAFHVHGDFSTEWVKCMKIDKNMSKLFVQTVILPSVMQEINKHYLILEKKYND